MECYLNDQTYQISNYIINLFQNNLSVVIGINIVNRNKLS